VFRADSLGGDSIQLAHHNYNDESKDSSKWGVEAGKDKRFKIVNEKGTYYEYSASDDYRTMVLIGTNDPNIESNVTKAWIAWTRCTPPGPM
jgi:hypothetical protein